MADFYQILGVSRDADDLHWLELEKDTVEMDINKEEVNSEDV